MLNGLSGPRKNLAFPFTLDLSVFTVLRFATCVAVLELFSKSFKVISLFSYQGSLLLSQRQLVYIIISICFCQQLFILFFAQLFVPSSQPV